MKKTYLLFTAFIACIFLFTSCKKEEFIVTFNPNGGQGAPITQTFTQKVAQPLMANSFTNDGFAFTGWNTKTDGTGTSYKDEETVIILDHLVLYAQWETTAEIFTVTFHPNGATDGDMEPQQFKEGVSQALSPNGFLFDDYWFSGWNTSSDGKGKSFRNEQIVSVTSDMTLYAQWEITPNTYYITFDANEGEGAMEPQKIIGVGYHKLDSNKFTRTDHIFTGWNTKANGTGTRYGDGASIYMPENRTLYAQWAGIPQPCPGIPNVIDVDGNSYNTVQIGSQCWTRENLKTTKYNTGETILLITDYWQWFDNKDGAMFYYNYNPDYKENYGALYSGYAAYTGNLCPKGWRVPSDEDWNELANTLGGAKKAGYKMKTMSGWHIYWEENSGNGSNESGFTAIPAGVAMDHSFGAMSYETLFWSSTKINDYSGRARRLYGENDELSIKEIYLNGTALSIRCVKD